MLGSPRRCRLAGGRACQMASPPKPSQRQTKLRANHAASGPCYNLTSSWSYTSSVSNCSYTSAITLDSYSESHQPICATKPKRDKKGTRASFRPRLSAPATRCISTEAAQSRRSLRVQRCPCHIEEAGFHRASYANWYSRPNPLSYGQEQLNWPGY